MATKASKTELQPAHRHDVSVSERYKNDELREIKSLEDALKLLTNTVGGVKSIEEFELGTGFKLLEDKARLVGVPFLIIHFQFNEGDFSDEFVSVTLITMDNNQDRMILNDGSTGIRDQLKDIAETGRYVGISVPGGLRASEYDTCVECGKPRKPSADVCPNEKCGDTSAKRGKGTTYYLDVNG